MIARLKSPMLVSALVALIFLFGYHFKTNLPQLGTKPVPETLNDFHVSGLSVQFFDHEGHQIYALTSPKLEHIPHQDTYHFFTPHFTVSPTDKPHWTIDADNAIAKARGQEIILTHHVTLNHAPFQTQPKGRIETEKLSLYPKKNYAETDKHITWTQQNNHVYSEGMKAYLDENRVELFHAKAIYESTA